MVNYRYTRISDHGSERATSSFGNRIVALDGKVHVAWQDSCAPGPTSGVEDALHNRPYADYPAQVRSLDISTGNWLPTVTLGMGQDNHGRPTIVADRADHLHVILGGHHTPMRHYRSVEANDTAEWEMLQEFGKNTYPFIVSGLDNTFYLLARHDEDCLGTDLFIRRAGGTWIKECLLVTRDPKYTGYGAFPSGLAVGTDGVLHYVSDFYESNGFHNHRGVKQAVAAMQSLDGGRSWQRADGTPVQIPARAEDMDLLEIHHNDGSGDPAPVVLSHGCIGVDSRNVPHIFYVSHLRRAGEMILATPDANGAWHKRIVNPTTTGFPTHRPRGECRGCFVVTGDDRMHLVLTLYPINDHGWTDGKPIKDAQFNDDQVRVVKLTSMDFGATWSVQQLGPPREGGGIRELNLERSSVHHPIEGRDPYCIFFAGLSRHPKDQKVINTRVYFAKTGCKAH